MFAIVNQHRCARIAYQHTQTYTQTRIHDRGTHLALGDKLALERVDIGLASACLARAGGGSGELCGYALLGRCDEFGSSLNRLDAGLFGLTRGAFFALALIALLLREKVLSALEGQIDLR